MLASYRYNEASSNKRAMEVGPLRAVAPRNDAYAGGGKWSAVQPTGVRAPYDGPATTGLDSASANLHFARNDRGSGVTVPYARVVPASKGHATRHLGDGHVASKLEPMELAWIRVETGASMLADFSNGGGSPLGDLKSVVEHYATSENAPEYLDYANDARKLAVDLNRSSDFEDQRRSDLKSLRGITVMAATAEVEAHLARVQPESPALADIFNDVSPSNPYTQKHVEQLVGYVPDGVCLSRDVEDDDLIDGRYGSMFNVAVQGPAVTKTWCNRHDPDNKQMQTLEKLLVVVTVEELRVHTTTNPPSFADCKIECVQRMYDTAKTTLSKAPLKKIWNPRVVRTTSRCLRNLLSHYECAVINTPKTYGVVRKIVGGWCIGSVLDVAAARTTDEHGQISWKPRDYAANVCVDVRFLSRDDLIEMSK